jgi:hypothetical protein
MPIEVSQVAKDAQDSVNFSARGSRTLKRVVTPQQQEGITRVTRQTTAATLRITVATSDEVVPTASASQNEDIIHLSDPGKSILDWGFYFT